ncbi:hypothetical protein B7463_g6916, partial [Scytalidium lignicola]
MFSTQGLESFVDNPVGRSLINRGSKINLIVLPMEDPVEIPSAFQEAYEKFIRSVRPVDAARFENLTIEDIRETALTIEASQAKRRSLRNLRRIEPLLEALGKYGKTIDVLCNQTPYLAFVWIANEHTATFEKLIRAYGLIAEALPRFDRYQATFQDRPELRHVLGLIYSDILEFHSRTYAFFRRKSWQVLFDSLWRDFNSRFNSIIESITRHRDLVDKEATSIDIAEARVWRVRAQEEVEEREHDKRIQQLNRTIDWLRIDGDFHIPDDDLYRFSKSCLSGTCKWILRDKILVNWRKDDEHHPVMWMKGIPGAGKTILSACIIQDLMKDSEFSTAYYFCDSNSNIKDLCGAIIRSLAIQLVQQNPSLAVYVDTKHVSKGIPPSRARLDELIPELLSTIETPRVVIDGLDECSDADQKEISAHILRLFTGPHTRCKVLFSSRESVNISGSLLNLRNLWPISFIDEIEQKMLAKAAGMFLWVRLVVSELQESLSLKELTEAVDGLPEGLHEAYQRLLDRIQKKHGENHRQKAHFILHWIAGSFRTLKTYEVQNGVVLASEGTLNDSNCLPRSIFDLCKPIIEEGPGNTIRFVHFSAKQYVLHKISGPFFDNITASRTIIRGSAAYLPMANNLIDSSIPEERSLLCVLKGFHDLHNFVHDFWSDHVVSFILLHSTSKKQLTNSDLDLLGRFQTLGKRADESGPMDPAIQLSPQQLEQVSALHQVPGLQNLVRRFLCFRASLRSENYATMSAAERDAYELRHDPTVLTEISQRYTKLVGYILELDTSRLSETFQPEMIAEFKQRHSETAFPCRYRFCSRASSGFRTEKEREIHETSHRPRIKCLIASCEFHIFGFGSQQALDRHNSQYHRDREAMGNQGSRLIRRKFDLALRAHFMESDTASTRPKRPRTEASSQPTQSQAKPSISQYKNREYLDHAAKSHLSLSKEAQRIADVQSMKGSREQTSAEISPISPSDVSPRFAPVSPAFFPTSPGYSPTSPNWSPTSPAFSPSSPYYAPTSPNWSPTSPAFSPSSPHSLTNLTKGNSKVSCILSFESLLRANISELVPNISYFLSSESTLLVYFSKSNTKSLNYSPSSSLHYPDTPKITTPPPTYTPGTPPPNSASTSPGILPTSGHKLGSIQFGSIIDDRPIRDLRSNIAESQTPERSHVSRELKSRKIKRTARMSTGG